MYSLLPEEKTPKEIFDLLQLVSGTIIMEEVKCSPAVIVLDYIFLSFLIKDSIV